MAQGRRRNGGVAHQFPRPQSVQSVTARIGFSIDLDLHEKLLRRIRSRWCKNHIELDLYVFVSIQFFFVFRSE
jgi:hypothetical protein